MRFYLPAVYQALHFQKPIIKSTLDIACISNRRAIRHLFLQVILTLANPHNRRRMKRLGENLKKGCISDTTDFVLNFSSKGNSIRYLYIY